MGGENPIARSLRPATLDARPATKARRDGALLDALHELRQFEYHRVITVRMPATAHARLCEDAHAARRSQNDHCLALLFAAHEEFFVGLVGSRELGMGNSELPIPHSPLASDPQPGPEAHP